MNIFIVTGQSDESLNCERGFCVAAYSIKDEVKCDEMSKMSNETEKICQLMGKPEKETPTESFFLFSVAVVKWRAT